MRVADIKKEPMSQLPSSFHDFSVQRLLNIGYDKDLAKNPRKCFLLAWMLTNFSDDTANWAAARQYYRQSVELGYEPARFNFGVMLVEGIGGDKDLAQGFSYIKQAAQNGYGRAWSNLSFLYQYGIGTAVNLREAEASCHKAIENGFPMAACTLAYLYLFHEEFSVDRKEKFPVVMRYLTMGELQDHSGSLYILGRVYNEGWGGVIKDKAQAMKCFTKAAKQGHYMSFRALANEAIDELEQLLEKEGLRKKELVALLEKSEDFEEKHKKALEKRDIPIEKFRNLQAHIEIAEYEFKNTRLFISAIARQSIIGGWMGLACHLKDFPNGECLEWIGDAILNSQVRNDLVRYQSDKLTRGQLDARYQQLICNASESHPHGGPLYRVAKTLGFRIADYDVSVRCHEAL